MFSAYSTFLIYLIIGTCSFVYIEFFQGVYFPFIRSVYYVHDVVYGVNRLFIVQKMLHKFGFVVPVIVITVVLPEPEVKLSTCLPYILLIAVEHVSLYTPHF